jgi:hypothetical protein
MANEVNCASLRSNDEYVARDAKRTLHIFARRTNVQRVLVLGALCARRCEGSPPPPPALGAPAFQRVVRHGRSKGQPEGGETHWAGFKFGAQSRRMYEAKAWFGTGASRYRYWALITACARIAVYVGTSHGPRDSDYVLHSAHGAALEGPVYGTARAGSWDVPMGS